MPLALGLDLGTTTLTALALDLETGEQAGCVTAGNTGEITSLEDKPLGRSEWDVAAVARVASACLGELAARLGPRTDLVGLGVTGQQHGVVLVDDQSRPLTPFVNWQDRRGDEAIPGGSCTWVQEARSRLGEEAPLRTGCRLATGYLGLTLFWLAAQGRLPRRATACFLPDYLTAVLTGRPPVTDDTLAASSGLLDVRRGEWDRGLIASLGLPGELFPPVRPAGERLGGLPEAMANQTGLPPGLPVFVGLGDNQASFLGSVAHRDGSVLVNVGTGGQVAVFTPDFAYDPELETRPFPGGGFLLVAAGLVGGSAYALLERFFRDTAGAVLGAPAPDVYAAMNRLAAEAPRGADGLRCEPFFAGTRLQPELRGSFTGASPSNFTPGHLARALLEGVARVLACSHETIRRLHARGASELVGAGNGIRGNPLLGRIIAEEFGLPMVAPVHREEAAAGAALTAAVGAGVFPDFAAAGRVIRHVEVA
jgi:sugar (pentulose or hexulose) kinase